MPFTWVPFFKELARKLVEYRNRQQELVQAVVDILPEEGLAFGWLNDMDAQGNRGPLTQIDPFTFFASFNRGITTDKRLGILRRLRLRFKVEAPTPEDLDGIPVVDNRNSWFISYARDRRPEDIPNLWNLHTECVQRPPSGLTPQTFESCIQSVGLGKMTMGLFWMNPDEYVALDGVMKSHLAEHVSERMVASAATLSGYSALVQAVRQALPSKRFCEISARAWMSRQRGGISNWVMAVGEQSGYWDDCRARGVIRVGWDELDADLSDLTLTQLGVKYQEVYGNTDELKGIREFVFDMKPGDRVFIKKGRRRLIALGEITGDYCFDPGQSSYRHFREANWLTTGDWVIPQGMTRFPVKTLTPIADPGRVQELLSLIDFRPGPQVTPPAPPPPALNIILYGPPGTGKTYELRRTYMPLFTETTANTKEQFADELVAEWAWWEVIAAAVYDSEQKSVTVSEILDHPLTAAKVKPSTTHFPRQAVWAALQTHTKQECDQVKYDKRFPPLLFTKESDATWTIDREMAEKEVPELVQAIASFRRFTPTESTVCRYRFVTFHQSFSYEDFVEGIKPLLPSTDEGVPGELVYDIKRGVFRELAELARLDPDHRYAIFIDEINRGNVANIFGELITLVEDDKRLGSAGSLEGDQAWTSILPYSREKFRVPRNLYLIGTMNTADRSVEALDTALRRRFTFVPVYPQPELLREHQPEGLAVDLEKLLRTVNDRLEVLLDTDHQIGHSYLMSLKDAEDPLLELRRVFANKILPLLQEYFYGDPAKIGMVLGSKFVHKRSSPPKLASGDWDTGELEEKELYEITGPKEWDLGAFQSIYA